jgi:AcrR family transcriptional regulator
VTASPAGAPGDAPPQARILAAATAHIRRGGVREVRVQAVAAEAGVSTPLVYHYFGNRAGLVRAALAAAVAGGSAPAPPAGASPRDRLVGLLVGVVNDAPERREAAAMRNELAASAVFDPELASLLAADTARREAAVASALRSSGAGRTGGATDGATGGAADGVRPGAAGAAPAVDDAGAAARGLVGLADGLAERWLGGLLTADRVHALMARAVDAVLAR